MLRSRGALNLWTCSLNLPLAQQDQAWHDPSKTLSDSYMPIPDVTFENMDLASKLVLRYRKGMFDSSEP
ncbi:MAG: hypothetical protein U0931_35865 [Vulcanimicrobiota bacterium]